MANIYQLWDNTVLNSANATPEQLEQKRNSLKMRFEEAARKNGASSKDIYATIDKFDQYSRQKTTTRDDGLTPDEREAARDDGSTILGLNKGALKAGARGAKDALVGIASSVPATVGYLAQTWSDVGENNPSELSAQLARKMGDVSHDMRSTYSDSTKQAKKDVWSPTGLGMALAENLGQVALTGGVVGGAGKLAGGLAKAAKLGVGGQRTATLGAGLTTGAGLGYGQGYGQGKENALEKINNTSNEDLYAGVVAEFDDWQKSGAKKSSKPEIVSLYEEAEGDLDTMKDLMAENAGNLTGLLTTATAPIAMGATAFANRGVINEMARQGTGNFVTRNLAAQTGARDAAEFARRVAARDAATGLGGKIAANTAIARQGLKIAGKQSGLQALEEGIQEGGEGYFAADAGSLARGDKGVLSDKDWSEVGQQGLQGAAIGALMGTGTSLVTMRDAEKTGLAQAKARTELPKQYQDAFNAFEDAKQAEAQAQAAHEANPTPESEDALNEAINERARANNQFNQYDAAFKQSFTEQEQKDLLANSLSGIAARAKLAEEAKQAELNSKAEQDALAKAQRANMVKGLAAYADNEEVLLNEVNQLGLDDTQKELLLREVFAERKNAKAKPQQTQTKTPLELAVDEHFDAKGNRKPSVMSPDIADKHKVSLDELLSAIAKRSNDIKIQKAQAEKKAKQQAQLDEDAKAFQQSQAKLEADAKRKAQEQQKAKEQGLKQDALTEKQQLENTLADFAAENDTDSMLSMLEGYDKTEADKLFNNAFKTVETRAKEADKATKAKEAETAKQEQAKQKQSAFSADMSALYESNPNATYNDWKAIGKKHGVTSAIDLASAWANARTNKPKQKDEQKPKSTETLALPAPDTVMVADAQGNVIPTTENNVPKKPRGNDFSVPSGLKVDVSNVENTRSDLGRGSYIGSAMIVRQDGQPFPTEQVAQQALANKATKKTKPKKNEPVITKDTHTVVPVDGGFAIAPVEAVTQKQVNTQADDTLVGDYAHTQLPDAVATVSKTEKGYDINWGDEVQSFTGKNAAEKTQAALKKENFNKKNPDNDNGGVAVEPVAPKPVSPMGGNSAPQAKQEKSARSPRLEEAYKEIFAKPIEDWDANDFAAIGAQANFLDGQKHSNKEHFADNALVQKLIKKIINDGIKRGDSTTDIMSKVMFGAFDATFTIKQSGVDALRAYIEMRKAQVAIAPTVSAPQTTPKTDADQIRTIGNTTQTTQTTGEQIAQAMDKTAKAITDAAHSKVVERVKNGEEIVYKQSAAIERAKQDDRYQVEINDKGHAVVKNIKDLNGEWVKKNEPIAAEATHIENGKIEEVTGEVIRESLAKVDDKPIGGKTINLKEAKQWLLDKANKALNEATIDDISKSLRKEIDYGSSIFSGNSDSALEREKKRLEKNKSVYEKLEKEIGYVTFDVPNDGSFRVLKTKKSLERFIKQVQSNKGFTETKKQSSSSDVAGQSPESVIKDFFSDRELDNAYEYSKLKGKPMRFGKPYEDKIPAYALTESFDVHGIEFFVGLSTEKEKTGANTYGYKWRVIEPKTGFAIGASQNTKKEAVDEAKKQLTKHVVDTNVKAAIAREVDSTIYVSESQREQKWLASIGHVTEDNVSAQKPQNINKKSADIENLYDLALGAAKATQIKADRDKNKPVDFAANTFEDKWQKAINGDAKAIKDIRDYFVNNKRVPNMTKAHLIIFEGLTNQDFTSKTYEYVASKFDEYINGFSDVNTNNSSTQKIRPTFDDVMTHLKGIHNLSAESFKDAQTKAVIKNTLEDYLDKVMPNDVSAKEFKFITDKFFNELVSSYPQTEHQSSGMLAHPIPEIAKQTNQPTKKESLLIKIDDELDAALDDLANVFKEQGKRLSSGVDPVIMGKVLAIGMKASTLYLAKGAVKFAVWAENIVAALSSKGVPQDAVQPYLKGLYLASKAESSPEIRQQMDKEDDVYDFDFAILNESNTEDTQNVTTPSQTNRDNAGERDKTPESAPTSANDTTERTRANNQQSDAGVARERRIGASFPEMAELNEKQQALNELEQELNAESKADDGLEQSPPQDSDSKPKFSQSSTIGDRTITQVRDKLISRFGKRIIDLLESKGILKIHQSMSDKDIPAEALRQVAFHGSPHKFDKFSLEHLGSGEGAQAYGWGLYFASKKSVSEWYREKLSKPVEINNELVDRFINELKTYNTNFGDDYEYGSITSSDVINALLAIIDDNKLNRSKNRYSLDEKKRMIFDRISIESIEKELGYYKDTPVFDFLQNAKKTISKYKVSGQLYEVNIPEDNTMLLWDSWTNTQSDDVIKGLLSASNDNAISEEMRNDLKRIVDKGIWTGESIYKELQREFNSDKEASLFLKKHGINGIKYLDGSSRFAGEGTYNYVVFDDSAVEILKTYYSAQQGVTEGFYLNGTVHLIADNLTDETIIPTFVHELGGHKGFQEMMSPKAYELIMQQFDRLVAQGNAIAIKAKQRAEKAEKDTARQQDEYIPYLLTEQEKAQFATPQERNAVKRLIDHILRAVKGWVVRTLSKYNGTAGIAKRVSETLDARDIQLMAERMIKDIAKRGGDNNNSPKFSKTEQSQFDRLLAKADKMIAEQGKLLAPNGKPSKLNRYQWAQVRTDNFKNWFGDWENDPENASKVVDENGEPMVVYHGTNKDFTQFNKLSWVAYNPSLANDYAELKLFNRGGNSQVIATFVMAINPFNADLIKKIKPSEKYPYGLSVEAFIDSIENQSKIPRGTLDNLKSIIQKGRREEESGPTYSAHNFWNDAVSMFGFEGKNAIDQAIKEAGFDSIFYTEQEVLTVGLFEPTQIKSAISNNGDFSPTNPDIRFSRAEDKAKAAKDYVLDSVRIKKEVAANLNAKKELGWWHKTLGTQQNTAIQYKDFGRVYKTLQRLLQHQSSDVTDALEVAPTLLEKLDDWKDFKNQAKSIGRNISQGVKHKLTDAITDRMAVAKVIFGETLAKKALTQDELEQKLNSQQLSMYEEARAAINVSLKNTAMSEIIRSLLQADAINFDTVEKHLNQQTGFDEFVDEMLENVGARISNAQAELSQAKSAVRAGVKLITKAESDLVKATDKAQQKEIGKEIKLLTKTQEGLEKAEQQIKEEIARLSDMYNSISNVNNKVYQLIDEAYAPLMRFGDYALTMRDKTTGKVLSFMMFESKAERNRMVNYLGTEYGNTVDLETDTMSTEDFKQFKGVTPETVALFAKELGLDKNEAYQGYLKLAIPATSALTRRIQRKGTAGFNEDIQRVLASFVMSNARYSAKNIYLAKADKEISEIESGASVRDQAKKMRDNTIDPVDTFSWLRDLLFVWNLGGSVMFAFLNMTQPFLQTIPMLSQYVNTSFATKHVLRGIGVAGKAMATGNAPKGYEAEYKRAVHEGIVDPQNTFMLAGLERGGTGTTSKVWTGTKHILGLFAQMSESLNRKAVFIASLEVANAKGGAWLKQKGYASAYDFAVDVISQTQGVYNKANRSNWAHNPVGAPLLVFKQFSINYVEQMVRMVKNNNEGEEGKKAVLLMLFMLFSLAGGMGLPFIKDIFDGSETIAAFMGNPVNIEREMRLMGKEYFGETTTGALMDGWLNKLVIGEVLGADVQSRTSMGDLAPLTNFANKTIFGTDQHVKEGMSLFGAAGGLGEKVVDSFNFMANNEWGNAFINILPRFATSMYRGVEMMTTDETTDSKGRKLFDTTLGEGLVKFFDAQPVRMAELSRARGLEYDDIAIQSSKIDYYRKKWIKAAQKEDDEAIEQIEQDIEDWNENNEKYPVIFDRKRAYQTANKNDMTWGEREAKPPRGMEWLKEERPEM